MLSHQVLPYPLLHLSRPLSCECMRNLEKDQRTSFPEFMYSYDVSQFLTRYAISSDSSYWIYHDQAFNDCNRSIQRYCQSRSSHRKVQTFGLSAN
jgi:hypothetical protein